MATERLGSGFVPIWVQHEHLARYLFASQFLKGKTVVDCASGNGKGSEIYARNGADRVYAFDIDCQAVANASLSNSFSNLFFDIADGTSLPIRSETIDVYISFETIEHIDDDKAFLEEVARVLKNDGAFICSTPNRLATNPGKSAKDKPFNQYHVREYSPQDLLRLLRGYFNSIATFGQNQRWSVYQSALGHLGSRFSKNAAARIAQFLKLPRFLIDRPSSHDVLEARWDNETWEYLVAVCKEPKKG